ncbi:serine threonine kinase [Fusarium mundagurra]|uniref:Serine threonine kinase n=1 Tax=Fusarium mundagurra TaxID=1567541 RepID=A0A8H5YIZ1_9HYPO|nr:serine threonine kinase [Fusarium mundagurra]
MSRDHSTVVQSPLNEILRRRGLVNFFRSVEAKVSRHLPEKSSSERFTDSQNNLGTAFSNPIQLSERDSDVGIRTPDTVNDSLRNPLRIPSCSPQIFVYPRGDAHIPAIYHERFETLKGIFRDNTGEDPQLAEAQEYIDYSLRLCGTSPQDCVPSILVFCRPAEFKNLRTLLTSPQMKYQYALRRHELKYPWTENRMLAAEQGHKPFFNIYFWREKRPRELYWGRSPVLLRQETIEAYRPPRNPPSSISSTTMLGSVVQLPGLDQRCSTLGCVIKVDSDYYAITTMHMFKTSQSSGESPSVVESDSDNSTAPTVFTGIGVPLHNNKEMFEPDVYELLAEDDYDITDVQYDSLSEDEDCEADQTDDWSLDTGGSTLHQPSDGHHSEDTKEMLALFPSTQQLQASGELDLDWALIKVTNSDHCHLNAFYPSGRRSESMSLGKVAQSQPQSETPVLIVTSGKVPQKGFLQPGVTFLGGISGKTPSSVWTVVLDDGSSLRKGDSGSVVVDATSYDVYGHVVGCNPMGEIYISPYRAILRQIRRLFPEAAPLQQAQINAQEILISRPCFPMTKFPLFRDSRWNMVLMPSNATTKFCSTVQKLLMEYLRDNLIDGVNGEGKAVPYIPISALKTYFTKSHIDTIMRSSKVAHPDITTVTADFHTSYLRILSILSYIGYSDSINWFTSNHLQDCDLPLDERNLQHKPPWFNAFLEQQWKFCPIIISPDGNFKRVLPSKTIFPVTYEKLIRGKNEWTDSPRLWQVKVHPGYSHKLEGDLVVFKVYQGTRGHDMYTAETNIYSKVLKGTDSAITRTLTGFSFPESQRSIAVFEHANGGSLIDFFHTNSPPSSNEDILQFWKQILKLIETIAILHEAHAPDKLSKSSSGLVHQDIKPENILVYSKDENDSISGIDFKFDGCTLFEPKETPFLDRNRMYLPPGYSSNLPAIHSAEVDIWSLGAVFSDCLVWLISGEADRERYRGRRMMELLDPDPCYHDGVKRLQAVDEFHELAILHKKDDDLITPFMSRTILLKMLAPTRERCTAMEITQSFQAEVKRLRPSLSSIPTIPQPSSPGSVVADLSLARVLPEASRTNPTSPMVSGSLGLTPSGQSSVFGEQNSSSVADNESSEGEATVETVYGLLKDKEDLSVSKRSFVNIAIREVRKDIAKRRIAQSSWDFHRDQASQKGSMDDFSCMEHHKRQVMKTARVLSYMWKKDVDQDEMELFFASEATKKPRKFKKSSKIEQWIKHANVVKGACDMGTCLDSVLKSVCDNGKPRPIRIYILTNGVWEGTSGGSGAEGVIRTISRKCHDLRASGRELSGLSIQFIQFGDDHEGTRNLRRVERANSDLASVRHFTDSVPYIMSAGNHRPETPIPKISSLENEVQSIDSGAELRVI